MPQDAQPERGTPPPGAALGIDHFWDASCDRFFGRFASILKDFWKIFWKNLPSNLPPQTYYRSTCDQARSAVAGTQLCCALDVYVKL